MKYQYIKNNKYKGRGRTRATIVGTARSSCCPTVVFLSRLEEAFYNIGDRGSSFGPTIVFLSRLEEAFYDIGDSDTSSSFLPTQCISEQTRRGVLR